MEKKIIWTLTAMRGSTGPFIASLDEKFVRDTYERLHTDADPLIVGQVELFGSGDIPDEIFCSVTLTRKTGKVEDTNCWFKDFPYDDNYIYVDEEVFEVGTKCGSMRFAVTLAKEVWKLRKPEKESDWETGDFPLTLD